MHPLRSFLRSFITTTRWTIAIFSKLGFQGILNLFFVYKIRWWTLNMKGGEIVQQILPLKIVFKVSKVQLIKIKYRTFVSFLFEFYVKLHFCVQQLQSSFLLLTSKNHPSSDKHIQTHSFQHITLKLINKHEHEQTLITRHTWENLLQHTYLLSLLCFI